MNGDEQLRYARKVDQLPLYWDGASKVELWDFSRCNTNHKSRVECVALVASICYGKPPRDAEKLVERLWTESGGLPSSAFEFVRWGGVTTSRIECSLRNTQNMPTFEDVFPGTSGILELKKAIARHKKNIATFRLTVPIFIARQVMRHRQFSYQELSRRYTTDKQVPFSFWKPDLGTTTREMVEAFYRDAEILYSEIVSAGYRPEIARAVLPQALRTQFWMMGDVEAWANYFALRTDSHAQKEHQRLARAMLMLLKEHQKELYRAVSPEGGEFYGGNEER